MYCKQLTHKADEVLLITACLYCLNDNEPCGMCLPPLRPVACAKAACLALRTWIAIGFLTYFGMVLELLRFELYLNIENPKYRIAISELRMSAHSLAIEMGRHKSQSLSDRLCTTCNVPETEMHHVMFCSKFDKLRIKLFAVCRKEIRYFDKLISEERRFCKILELNTIPLANALGHYLTQASITMN